MQNTNYLSSIVGETEFHLEKSKLMSGQMSYVRAKMILQEFFNNSKILHIRSRILSERNREENACGSRLTTSTWNPKPILHLVQDFKLRAGDGAGAKSSAVITNVD